MKKNILILLLIMNFHVIQPIINDQYKGPIWFTAFHALSLLFIKNLPKEEIGNTTRFIGYPLIVGISFPYAVHIFNNSNNNEYPDFFTSDNAFKYFSIAHGCLITLYGLIFVKKSYDLFSR